MTPEPAPETPGDTLLFVETPRFKRAVARGAGQRFALRKTFALGALGAPGGRAIDRENLTVRFRLSTAEVDREGDSIAVAGWDLAAYRANPVVLWAHDYRQPPVARATSLAVKGGALKEGALVAEARFTPRELYPFGHMTFQLYAEGFLNAVSVGFRPLEWAWAEDDEPDPEDEGGGAPLGMVFARQELLEFSCVPVPANPEALVEARAKGIDTGPLADWAERLLDGGAVRETPLRRQQVERLRRAALGRSPASYHLPRGEQAALARRNLAAMRRQAGLPLPAEAVAGLVGAAVSRAVTRLTGRLD